MNNIMGVGQSTINLAEAFNEDPVITVLYSPRLMDMGLSMLGSTKHTIVATVDQEKDRVDRSPLELVAKGLAAINSGDRDAFYRENKKYGPGM